MGEGEGEEQGQGFRPKKNATDTTYTLKRIAFSRNDAITLAKIMLARGALCNSSSGMTGRATRLSTQRQVGKHTPDIASEAMVKGWDPLENEFLQ